MNYMLIKRTFEADKHPFGSAERARLNDKVETSEYMHSYKWLVRDLKTGFEQTFTSRASAEAYITFAETDAFYEEASERMAN